MPQHGSDLYKVGVADHYDLCTLELNINKFAIMLRDQTCVAWP